MNSGGSELDITIIPEHKIISIDGRLWTTFSSKEQWEGDRVGIMANKRSSVARW